jgi:hypothetical protein
VTTSQPRKTSVLLHADRDIVRRDDGTYAIAVESTAIRVSVDPPLTASVEPHVVVTQGRPGSVEQGEREQRGTRLTMTTAPQTKSRIEMTLRISELIDRDLSNSQSSS